MNNDLERKAEEWTETREALVTLPYTRATVRETIVSEQIASFLAGAAEAMRWRKCSEEMPEDGEMVLTYGSDEAVAWGFYKKDIGWEAVREEYQQITVLYWKSIGPPPTEQS